MKTYTVADLNRKPKQVFSNKQPFLVTNNGRPQSIVMNVANLPVDRSIMLAQDLYGKYCYEQIQQQSVQSGLNELTEREINAEIAAARQSRL